MDCERVVCDTCGQRCKANRLKRHKNSAVCKAIANANKYSELRGTSNDDTQIAQIVFGNFEGGSKMPDKHMRNQCKKYESYESVLGSKENN